MGRAVIRSYPGSASRRVPSPPRPHGLSGPLSFGKDSARLAVRS